MARHVTGHPLAVASMDAMICVSFASAFAQVTISTSAASIDHNNPVSNISGVSEPSRPVAMKILKDIFAKCITRQEFAAYVQSTRCGDSAKATPLKKLLDLPPELLLMIVDATEKSSLANMRLTCRKLQDLTIEAFGVAFFKTRHVAPSETSVDTLLEVARHAVFGHYVTGITLSSGFFQGSFGDIDLKVDLLHTFSSTMPKVLKNIQNNHGSVDLTFYDNPRFINGAVGNDLAEVFYMVTRMVKQSRCTLGRV